MINSAVLWYASRSTGAVALVLLTVVSAFGIAVNRQARMPGLPRFALTDLHRNLSLLAVVFLAVHVLTAVLDTYVSIPALAIVIPFVSGYERFWLGLGAVGLDLLLAMIVTSLVRGRLNRTMWRAVHLTAYLCWPVAFLHGLYSSGDLRQGPLFDLAIGCALIFAGAGTWRLVSAAGRLPRARRVAAELSAAERERQTSRSPRAPQGPRR